MTTIESVPINGFVKVHVITELLIVNRTLFFYTTVVMNFFLFHLSDCR